MNATHGWIVVADARIASLFECKRTPNGSLHIEAVKSIRNSHEAEHERGRPNLAGGAERRGSVTSSGAHAAPHTVGPKHTADEEHRRFAREVHAWLAETAHRSAPGRVTLFAPARFLGLLREESPRAGDDASFREGDLTHLRPQELAAHPAVLSALSAR
mgnify:FL=1